MDSGAVGAAGGAAFLIIRARGGGGQRTTDNEHGKPQTRAPEHSLACPSYGTNCRLAGRG